MDTLALIVTELFTGQLFLPAGIVPF